MTDDLADVLIRLGLTGTPQDFTDANGDLIWPHGKSTGGYGIIYLDREPFYVHRLVETWTHGPIPEDWQVDHVWEAGCRSRACFLPAHLEAVTQAENARRAGLATRQRPRSCGHPWGNGNDRANGQCKTCHRNIEAARDAPIRAAYKAAIEDRTTRILALRAQGRSTLEVARDTGVSRSTVRRTELAAKGS